MRRIRREMEARDRSIAKAVAAAMPSAKAATGAHQNLVDPKTGKLRWTVLPQQKPLFKSQARAIALVTGLGGGKSWAGSRKAALKVLENPGVLGLIAANTYRQLRRVVVRCFRDALRELGLAHRYRRNDSEIDVWVPTENGLVETTVICASLEARSESYDDLRGVELGWAWLDEARKMPRAAYDVALGRLRAQGMRGKHQIWLTTTPNGYDWIWEAFVDNELPGHELYQGTTEANVFLPPDYLPTLEATYDALVAQQELEGKFVAREGRLYHAFDRNLNMSPRVQFSAKRTIHLAWDFNSGERPMAMSVIQHVAGEIWVVDEIVITCSNVPEVCREFRRRYEKLTGGKGRIVIDGDAAGHTVGAAVGEAAYERIREELELWWSGSIEFHVPHANPHVADRVDIVNGLLCDAKGLRRLFIATHCKELRKDFEQVKPKKGAAAPDPSDPLRTHISDGVGYHCARAFPVYRFDPEYDAMTRLPR